MKSCDAVGLFAILEEMQSIYSEVKDLDQKINEKRKRFVELQKEIDDFIGFDLDSVEKAMKNAV